MTQPHFLARVEPIMAALPDAVRGSIYCGLNRNELQPWATTSLRSGRPPATSAPVLMAGGGDLPYWEARPVILVEHGAGQSYAGVDNVGFAGGIGRTAVVLFLAPNEIVAERDRARYPNARAAAVGDVTIRHQALPPDDGRVGISWHWDSPVAPETRSSWRYWADAAIDLSKCREVVGHAHPRAAHEIRPWWQRNGVRFAATFQRVVADCALYVTDSSSTLYEFAALGRPVVVLDAPWYRRDVEHGLRFWSHADVGVRIGDPADLRDAVALALEDLPEVRARREAIVADVYVATGEEAVRRSVEAIMAIL